MISLAKIEARRGVAFGVIGLGYVGLPLAIEFAKAGFPVIGFDLDVAPRVAKINRGKLHQAYPRRRGQGTEQPPGMPRPWISRT